MSSILAIILPYVPIEALHSIFYMSYCIIHFNISADLSSICNFNRIIHLYYVCIYLSSIVSVFFLSNPVIIHFQAFYKSLHIIAKEYFLLFSGFIISSFFFVAFQFYVRYFCQLWFIFSFDDFYF